MFFKILPVLYAHDAGFLSLAGRDVFVAAIADNHDAYERFIHIFPALGVLFNFRFYGCFFHINMNHQLCWSLVSARGQRSQWKNPRFLVRLYSILKIGFRQKRIIKRNRHVPEIVGTWRLTSRNFSEATAISQGLRTEAADESSCRS